MNEPGKPVRHNLNQSAEEVEAFWRQSQPIMAAQKVAAHEVAAAPVTLTVAEARARVERESEERGVPLRVEFDKPGGRRFAKYEYGRILALVRDGVVVRASAG